jgi:hypothetical protein
MQSIVNLATIGPIVFMVCLMINEETLNFMPSRHYSAYIIGIFPSIYDWLVNVSARTPLSGFLNDGDNVPDYNTTIPPGSTAFIGILAWKRGSLLVSMLWVAMIVMVLDRKWAGAIAWAMISSMFALFGIIHMPTAGFKTFSEPLWEQCEGLTDANGDVVGVSCWDFAEQWMFFVAYLMMAATFAIILVCKKFDKSIEDAIDDESAHAFDDWFKDAGKKSPDDLSSDDGDDLEKPVLREEGYDDDGTPVLKEAVSDEEDEVKV